ncbi:hypothetical protein HGO34_03335 [Agrobacterium vitis]|uniref:Uncharacterized protein n=1 Tax=Agrobacterium vitis TaxID=373 RepID=A0AAE4WBJ3_AGRVI|nr:hypothetical protein [Agrobacterium vitis]MCF1501746.1 hypothetical protein [Allorhizobium sp. Av2]MCM2438747.1 hypothetical protein [Agrobacterium vitis]MUZ56974.1 hypothetical protein [Agrobacterium vitis]MVA69152.1 hypothetical protein [Agrobacterium vitis]MVA85890.1 hypothetical protein [Agrobacterium vitis]
MNHSDFLIERLASGAPLPEETFGEWDNRHLSGAYHSVHASSYWSNGLFPKGFKLTLNMRFAPNFLAYKGVNNTNEDKLYINQFDTTLDDVTGPVFGNARFNEVRIRQLSATEFQVLELLDGDVIIGQYWCFAKDASTLIRWGVGKAPDGKSKAFFETFARSDQ